MTRRPRLLVLLALLLGLVLGGCVGLPEDGPVRSVAVQEQGEGGPLVDYTPGGPKPGSAPVPLVDNFLKAMTATPLTTAIARQFLTSGSSSGWVPEKGTVVYGGYELAGLPGGGVALRLHDVVELDRRGGWLGDPTRGGGRTYDLRLVREGGEWRISNPPDRLVVPALHFDTQYVQYYLYFFDKSAQVLVPEPVYVPRGQQAPTLLVAGLLSGPGSRGVETSFLPGGTDLDGLSVPVSRDGTAEVPLSDHVLDVGDRQLSLLFAQLGWTLGQIAGVERIRVTVDGTPLDLPGSRADVGVDQASEFDPAVAWASTALFGIRDRRVVSVVGSRENRLSGPFGTVPTDLRSLAVDLPAQHVAAVTGDGTRVLTGDTERSPDEPAVGMRTVYVGGRDVLRPAFDLYGQTWLVDRTASGARVVVVRNGGTRVVDAPGVSGRDVARFVLSRDGTRLVAQVRSGGRDGRDGLVVSRVRRDARGRVRSVTPAVPLPLAGVGTPRLRDLAWRSPGTLAVLAGPTAGSSQVLVVKIDGSSTPEDLTGDAEVFRDQAVQLVTAPYVGAPLYIRTAGGQLFALSGTGRWTGTSVRPGLGAPTFVG